LVARRDSVPRYGQAEPIEALRVFAIISRVEQIALTVVQAVAFLDVLFQVRIFRPAFLIKEVPR
jgi:hypothetical protein